MNILQRKNKSNFAYISNQLKTKMKAIKESCADLIYYNHLDKLVVYFINAQLPYGDRYTEIIALIDQEIDQSKIEKINKIKKEDDAKRIESKQNEHFDIFKADLIQSNDILNSLAPDVIYKQLENTFKK